ncbi:hypothetical protein [Magnetospirillum molischianum]|uniref:Uncharacterized protein n=1 Tax=Magnetospirillum molischianum DSM 120 TaxID=1150626 RepID=H8FY18_MAGML|nr:hypothetical protein [Magnetospirillum molischianum]CCG43256.1 hypothetical protein PHAMO_80047 [Magnetospirillum molischianum DSM 120]
MENFANALALVTPEQIEAKRAHVESVINARIEREVAKGTTLPAKLAKHRDRFVAPGVLRVLCAMGVDLSLVFNEAKVDGQQFCEKALNRACLALSRAVNYAIPLSEAEIDDSGKHGKKGSVELKYIHIFMHNASILASLGEYFTSDLQCFTVSNKYTPKGKRVSGLLRHSLAVETASRQSGLTRRALIALGVAKGKAEATGRDATIVINLEHPLSQFFLNIEK